MKREDLFIAIGQVEAERLARCEKNATPSNEMHWEGTEMKTNQKQSSARVIRGLLIAAVVVTMLATTAFAYTGFVVYENPRAMLEAFFGVQPQAHGADCMCEKCTMTVPTAQREELDLNTATEDVAPFISQVGDHVFDECMGNRLTVDAYTYDPATGCGLVYYTLENEKGRTLIYNLQPDGEIYDISPSTNYPCKEYLVQGESTATRLKIACYFIRDNIVQEDYFRIGFNGLIRENTEEETTDYLYLPLTEEGMKSLTLADGELILSPIGLKVGNLSCVGEKDAHEPEIHSLRICYRDGSEYVVTNDADGNMTRNYGYSLMEFESDFYVVFALNRVVDLDQVTSVVINETEFLVK